MSEHKPLKKYIRKRQNRKNTRYRYFSVSKSLRRRNKISPEFEIMLNTLSLEEVIALKLELGANASGAPMYGFNIWRSLLYIVKDAALKYAISATRSRNEAGRFLGIDEGDLWKVEQKYRSKRFFEDEEE